MKETHLHPPLHATAAPSAHKPGRLGSAEARLGSALDRLEQVLGGIEPARGADAAAAAEVAARVARLQDENVALQQTQDQIAGRLDAAVDRLRRVLAD